MQEELKDTLLRRTAQQMLLAGMGWAESTTAIHRQMIIESLRQNKGNLCRAARTLRMHRNTLSRQIEELRIDSQEIRDEFRSQRALKYGGRLPINSPAMRRMVKSSFRPANGQQKVA